MGSIERFKGWKTQKNHMEACPERSRRKGKPNLGRRDIFIIPYTINREIWLKQTELRDQRSIDKGCTVVRKESLLYSFDIEFISSCAAFRVLFWFYRFCYGGKRRKVEFKLALIYNTFKWFCKRFPTFYLKTTLF